MLTLKMGRVTTVVILAGLLPLAGCNIVNQEVESRTGVNADELVKRKTKYVGDNSAVMGILTAAGVGKLGKYQIALQTQTEPYGLTVKFVDTLDTSDPKKLTTKLDQTSVLVLASIDNAQYVNWEHQGKQIHRVTTADATRIAGTSVKEIGAEQLRKLADEYAK